MSFNLDGILKNNGYFCAKCNDTFSLESENKKPQISSCQHKLCMACFQTLGESKCPSCQSLYATHVPIADTALIRKIEDCVRIAKYRNNEAPNIRAPISESIEMPNFKAAITTWADDINIEEKSNKFSACFPAVKNEMGWRESVQELLQLYKSSSDQWVFFQEDPQAIPTACARLAPTGNNTFTLQYPGVMKRNFFTELLKGILKEVKNLTEDNPVGANLKYILPLSEKAKFDECLLLAFGLGIKFEGKADITGYSINFYPWVRVAEPSINQDAVCLTGMKMIKEDNLIQISKLVPPTHKNSFMLTPKNYFFYKVEGVNKGTLRIQEVNRQTLQLQDVILEEQYLKPCLALFLETIGNKREETLLEYKTKEMNNILRVLEMSAKLLGMPCQTNYSAEGSSIKINFS